MPPSHSEQDVTYIDITVRPRSSQRKISIDEQHNIKAYLNSPPVDGKANAECIALFAEKLCIPKSSVSIYKGTKGKRKTVAIRGCTKEKIIKLLRS